MDTTKKLSASYVVIGVKEKIGYGFGDLEPIPKGIVINKRRSFLGAKNGG